MPTIRAIYRYPVKGLSPEPMPRAALRPGETVPGDRLYAIENGPSGFDPAHPNYLPKQRFLMLMKNERLAALHTTFDDATHTLTITYPSALTGPEGTEVARPRANVDALSSPSDRHPTLPTNGRDKTERMETVHGDLRTAAGRAAIERFFAAYCADELHGPPHVLHADGHSFSDVAKKVVSIINLASVKALEAMAGAQLNPLRFRANLYVDGWPAWSELDLLGRELTIAPAAPAHRAGSAGASVRLKVVKRIVRCAATNVDPDTGTRDRNVPKTLMDNLGHADCGIYAEVIEGGAIAAGDAIAVA